MYNNKKVSAIIAAAGRGRRMGSELPKQYLVIGDKTILDTTLYRFEKNQYVDEIVLVVNKEDIDYVKEMIACQYPKVVNVVRGMDTRTLSVYEGIKNVSCDCGILLIHDGVRPFVSNSLICLCTETADSEGACVPAVEVTDTIKDTEGGYVASTPDRSRLRAVQTPQAFAYEIIKSCYDKAVIDDVQFTDDSSLVEHYGYRVKVVEGLKKNIKITTPFDLKLAGIMANIY